MVLTDHPVSASHFVLVLIGCYRSTLGSVLLRLQNIHEAVGLRYQWGGSHCNKALLCCLGIDTRNIVSPSWTQILFRPDIQQLVSSEGPT